MWFGFIQIYIVYYTFCFNWQIHFQRFVRSKTTLVTGLESQVSVSFNFFIFIAHQVYWLANSDQAFEFQDCFCSHGQNDTTLFPGWIYFWLLDVNSIHINSIHVKDWFSFAPKIRNTYNAWVQATTDCSFGKVDIIGLGEPETK